MAVSAARRPSLLGHSDAAYGFADSCMCSDTAKKRICGSGGHARCASCRRRQTRDLGFSPSALVDALFLAPSRFASAEGDVSLPRRQQGVDVLGAADAEREDAPFSLGVVRVKAAPVGFRVEVVERLFVQVPAMGRVNPTAVARVVRCADE